MRQLFMFAFLVLLGPVARADAAITLSTTSVPTPNVSGFITWTLIATAAADERIIGFDFANSGAAYGFTGPMHQHYILGNNVIFTDIYAAIFWGGVN